MMLLEMESQALDTSNRTISELLSEFKSSIHFSDFRTTTKLRKLPSNNKSTQIDISKKGYGEVLFDKNKVFHGIDYDFIRLKNILQYGILSAEIAKLSNNDIEFSRNYNGVNFDDSISVVECPAIHNTFVNRSSAFYEYVSNSISFIIEDEKIYKGIKKYKRRSQYIDEAYIFGGVDKEKINGIMVSTSLSTPINILPLRVTRLHWDRINARCLSFIYLLQKECGFYENTDQLQQLINQKDGIENQILNNKREDSGEYSSVIMQIEKFLRNYVQKAYSHKLNKVEVTLGDVLSLYVPENIVIYNHRGFPIDLTKDIEMKKHLKID